MMNDGSNEEYVARYCKKCGAELPSTEKKKLCINCRRKRGEKIKNAITVAAACGLAWIGKDYLKKPTNDLVSNPEGEDDEQI